MKEVWPLFIVILAVLHPIYAQQLRGDGSSASSPFVIYLPSRSFIVPSFTHTMPINLKNEMSISGIDIELRYPPGELSIIGVNGTARVMGKPTVYIDDPTEGIVRFFWAEDIRIDPGDGPIFEMTVSVTMDDVCSGPHEIHIPDVVVATTEGITRDVFVESGELFFRRRGDFNRDCTMDVLDALYIPLYIICLSCSMFLTDEDYMLLDFNNDGEFTFLDLFHMIEYILHQS